jgi:hypothetical protein
MSGAVMERLVQATREELARTLAALCAEIGAAESAILLPRDDTDLVFFAATNAILMQANAPRVPISASFTGIAYRTGQTIAVADAASQTQHFKAVDELVASRTREFAAIPITERRVLGVLTLVNRVVADGGAASPFGLAELRQAEALAREIAAALVQLPGLTGAPAAEGDPAHTLGAEFVEDLLQLHAGERRIAHAVVEALIQNRAE